MLASASMSVSASASAVAGRLSASASAVARRLSASGSVTIALVFPQDVLGCVCINPGRLTKGQVGGTYGRLYVQREDAEGERKSPCVAAQVVKI